MTDVKYTPVVASNHSWWLANQTVGLRRQKKSSDVSSFSRVPRLKLPKSSLTCRVPVWAEEVWDWSWIHHFIDSKPDSVCDGAWEDGGCSEQWDKEREKEEVETKQGERENGRESRWVFLVWTPSPSAPFSPRRTTPLSNGINNIPAAFSHRNLPAPSHLSAASSSMLLFFIIGF